MTAKQKQDPLMEKIGRIGYTAYEVLPGIDDLLMLHMQGHLICSVDYALYQSDEQLKNLIDETVKAPGGY